MKKYIVLIFALMLFAFAKAEGNIIQIQLSESRHSDESFISLNINRINGDYVSAQLAKKASKISGIEAKSFVLDNSGFNLIVNHIRQSGLENAKTGDERMENISYMLKIYYEDGSNTGFFSDNIELDLLEKLMSLNIELEKIIKDNSKKDIGFHLNSLVSLDENSKDANGNSLINYMGEAWYIKEGAVGNYETLEEDMLDDRLSDDSAKLKIDANGSYSLSYAGKTISGTLPQNRYYESPVISNVSGREVRIENYLGSTGFAFKNRFVIIVDGQTLIVSRVEESDGN